MGTHTGAGTIFGVTGGVMEAALRTAYYEVTGKDPDPDLFADIRTGPALRKGPTPWAVPTCTALL